jgi:type IV pilus assembly protein PilA
VAIIGILAAVAIPNFVRYQHRSRASERKINVEAIFKSEEALRQAERPDRPSSYADVGPLPSGWLPANSTTKTVWIAADLGNAQTIDWVVEGATYGIYSANAALAATDLALSVCGATDIDGDGTLAGDLLFRPMLDPITGDVNAAPPGDPEAAPCPAGVDLTGFALANLTYEHGVDPMGQVVQVSDQRVF